jgi:hypothetical protein
MRLDPVEASRWVGWCEPGVRLRTG